MEFARKFDVESYEKLCKEKMSKIVADGKNADEIIGEYTVKEIDKNKNYI